jgi:hypothetical protein
VSLSSELDRIKVRSTGEDKLVYALSGGSLRLVLSKDALHSLSLLESSSAAAVPCIRAQRDAVISANKETKGKKMFFLIVLIRSKNYHHRIF